MKMKRPLRNDCHRELIPSEATVNDNYSLRYIEVVYPDLIPHIIRAQIFRTEIELIMDDGRLLIFDCITNSVTQAAEDYKYITGAEIRRFFAKRFSTVLQWSGWSQANLAKEVDCTQTQISKYSKGLTTPGFITMIKIANAFGCSLDCFRFVDLGE
jgi:DNA-binding XRE family transcriptional regulator